MRMEGILPFVTAWIDLEHTTLEVNQTEKEKYYKVSLICRILKKLVKTIKWWDGENDVVPFS